LTCNGRRVFDLFLTCDGARFNFVFDLQRTTGFDFFSLQRTKGFDFLTCNGGRVPHISLVFREMWDTTTLNYNGLFRPKNLAV